MVLGAGTIGLVTLQAALLAGIAHVALLEPQPQRRERAAALGAHATYGSAEEPRASARDEGSAPTSRSTRSARRPRGARRSELLRPGGQAVCVGLAADDTTLGFHDVVRGQLRIQGSYAYTMADFEQAHEWLVERPASLGETSRRCARSTTARTRSRGSPDGPPPAEIKVFLAGAGREA